ncbi:MAG: leucine-rich repeat domain-containing protein [Ruminococcus sp.]|nr:leucine-rich repeat domain-containing protein [Ruminococcus sp.]
MKNLIGKLAAAASAFVLAVGCLAIDVSADNNSNNGNNGEENSASASASASDSGENGDQENKSKKKKKKKTDSKESTDSAAEEETPPADTLAGDVAENERDKENFHRSGAWGYVLLPDNTASISKYYGDSTHPGIPAEVDGFTVSAISGGWYTDDEGTVIIYGNVHGITYDETGMISGSTVYSPFSGNKSITEVTIPDSVKYVGAIAFKGCKKLKKVTMGSGVKVIGNNCFEKCESLKSIELPNSLEYIDLRAFSDCTALEKITLPAAYLEPQIFENCTALESVNLAAYDTLPQFLFAGCSALTEVTVPNGTRVISEGAFQNCLGLETVKLPDSLKEIHNNAFAGCTCLKEVQMGSQVEAIGTNAFADCPIERLALPDSLTKIGKQAFGMTADGQTIGGFTVVCPEYSPAQSYAETNELAVETVKGELPKLYTNETAETSTDEVSVPDETESEEQTEDGEQPASAMPDPLDSDLMYKLLMVIIGVTVVSIIAAIILIVKNHRLGDTPESEDYFPSDDYDDEPDFRAPRGLGMGVPEYEDEDYPEEPDPRFQGGFGMGVPEEEDFDDEPDFRAPRGFGMGVPEYEDEDYPEEPDPRFQGGFGMGAPANERRSEKPDFRSESIFGMDKPGENRYSEKPDFRTTGSFGEIAPKSDLFADKPTESVPRVSTPAADKVFELFGDYSTEKFSIAPLEDDEDEDEDDDADGGRR